MNQPTEIRIPDLFKSGIIFWVIIAIAVILGLITSIYTVQAESQGVVLRFGKYLKTVEPGLRFKMPFGIERVYVLLKLFCDRLKFFKKLRTVGSRTP